MLESFRQQFNERAGKIRNFFSTQEVLERIASESDVTKELRLESQLFNLSTVAIASEVKITAARADAEHFRDTRKGEELSDEALVLHDDMYAAGKYGLPFGPDKPDASPPQFIVPSPEKADH